MAVSTRTNKDGKIEYKARYYFFRDGKKRDSETGWFSSEKEALNEAEKLKTQKETEERYKVASRRDKQLITVYEEYIEYLKKKYESEDGNNTDKNIYIRAKVIKNKYFPYDLQILKINEISVLTFKSWLSHINNTDLGGWSVEKSKTILIKFNHWLSLNGFYIDAFMEDDIDNAIRRVAIKSTEKGNREDKGERNILTLIDFMKLTYFFYDEGLEVFENFYFYTLFYVLYFSGMRVEELCGLKWKNVDLRQSMKQIKIENAISEMESKTKAKERLSNDKNILKNRSSYRIIPIFEFYYELLCDYKESYKYISNLTYEEMEDCFVFPQIKYDKIIPNEYFKGYKIRKKLYEAIKAKELKPTDLQMFRHSCAYFLILPPPDGLGFAEEKVIDYFGHTDTKMLKKVYARLDAIQKKDRMKASFGDIGIYKPIAIDEKVDLERRKYELIKRIMGDNEKANKARQLRVFGQIDYVIEYGKDIYYYAPKDKWIIDKYIAENGTDKIQFVEET